MTQQTQQKKSFSSKKDALYGAFSMLVDHILKDQRYYSNLAKIVSVDEAEKTATVEIINGEELEGVRLQQVASESGLFLFPTVGSTVIVSWTDNTTAFITLYSEIDSIVFQGGENGGLIKIEDLVTKLNALVSEVDSLTTAFNSHMHATAAIGPPVTPTPVPNSIPVLPPSDFKKTDFENEKFKH